jgi:predicted enzyme related to lactoylglutathione lyase
MIELLANTDVDDLARAVEFYTRALGLKVGRRIEAFAAVELLGACARIYLLAKAAGTAPGAWAQTRRNYQRHWTPVHLDFVVKDLDAAVQRARAAGATLETKTENEDWGRVALMGDPFGHGFCLLQLTGRGYDEVVEPSRRPK